MPNIKSSIRSVKTDAERRAKNAAVKSQIRTAARETVEAVQGGAREEAKQALCQASSGNDKADLKGGIHKNTSARKKTNPAAKINALKFYRAKAHPWWGFFYYASICYNETYD